MSKVTKQPRNSKRPVSTLVDAGRFLQGKKTAFTPSSFHLNTNRFIGTILIGAGILMMGSSILHFYLQRQALTLSRSKVAAHLETRSSRAALPTKIFIRWFVDSAIEPMSLDNGIWGLSDTKATYLIQSARPGEAGNIIVYGHNTRSILGNIRALKGNEVITLTTADGKEHKYIVEKMAEVPPDKVELLQPTTTEVLTMYTCSGPLDSQRFIVRAIPYVR